MSEREFGKKTSRIKKGGLAVKLESAAEKAEILREASVSYTSALRMGLAKDPGKGDGCSGERII